VLRSSEERPSTANRNRPRTNGNSPTNAKTECTGQGEEDPVWRCRGSGWGEAPSEPSTACHLGATGARPTDPSWGEQGVDILHDRQLKPSSFNSMRKAISQKVSVGEQPRQYNLES
jgi:hypothetical protein